MTEDKPDLSEAVDQSIGGVTGEPDGDLPDAARVTKPEKVAADTPPDAGPIEPAGGIIRRAPHPDEAERSR